MAEHSMLSLIVADEGRRRRLLPALSLPRRASVAAGTIDLDHDDRATTSIAIKAESAWYRTHRLGLTHF